MSSLARVTVTLPTKMIEEMDRFEKNRSRFVLEAVQHECERRRRHELNRSLESPHVESASLADRGLEDWAAQLPAENVDDLLDPGSGKPIRWVEGVGWSESDE